MKIRIIFILLIFLSINVFSQEIDSTNNLNNEVIADIELDEQEGEEYEDEESLRIDVKDEVSKQSVQLAEDLLNYINILRDKDSLVYHFAIMMGDNTIVPDIDEVNLINIDRNFEVIFHPNTSKVMYVREMILNENQAWDFIYENIFDENGIERIFIRHYSTFNSVCAEVAFEISEYFFNENNELIKKTYDIYDGKHNPLNIDDCWMEREEYVKSKTFNELNDRLKLPLEGLPKINEPENENKEIQVQDKVKLDEITNPINQEEE